MLQKLKALLTKDKNEDDFKPVKVSLDEVKRLSVIADKLRKHSENVIETYELDYVAINIVEDHGQIFYKVYEPELPLARREFEDLAHEVFSRAYENAWRHLSIEAIFEEFLNTCNRRRIDEKSVASIWYHFYRDYLMYGPITPLILDDFVEDISCSGYDKPVYVYHAKYGFIPTNIVFGEDELEAYVQKLAQKGGVDLTYQTPYRDATLPDGCRVILTFKTISSHGSTFTIRKFKKVPLTPVDLINQGTFTPEQFAVLWLAIDARCSIVFVGETGSGKTTAMNATALFIPINSRVVSIEDTKELNLPYHKNWESLVHDDILKMLKITLRKRPEYILIGEARGEEIKLLFHAMNIGHTTLTTLHAGDLEELILRLKSDPLNLSESIISALNFVVVLKTLRTDTIARRKCIGVYFLNRRGLGKRIGDQLYAKPVETLDDDLKEFFQNRLLNIPDVTEEFSKRVDILRKLRTSSAADFCRYISTRG